MKIDRVEIHSDGVDSVGTLSFADPERHNPYNVKSIMGIDADEIISQYYGASGTANERYYALSVQQRDVIMRVELNPDFTENQTVSDLRDELYRMIASSRTGLVELWFAYDEEVIAVLSGFITKLETNHFDKTQEVTLTLRTKEPMLKAQTETVLETEGTDLSALTVVDNKSTAPHGFKMEISFIADQDFFILSSTTDAGWAFQIEPFLGFEAGDVLHFSSEKNNKYLYIVRDEDTIHVADRVLAESIWPIIFPGENIFTMYNYENMVLEALSHYPTYWGI